MAVPYYRRSVSKKEYAYNFKKLEKEILSLLLEDFGVKEEQKINCPEWLIDTKRKEILKSLSDVSAYISRAGAFFSTSEELRRERIILQKSSNSRMFCFI